MTSALFRRIIAGALACLLACTTIVSALCIAELGDHDCVGDDCDICLVLEISKAALQSASIAAVGAVASAAFALLFAHLAGTVRRAAVGGTPVSWKVRMIV